MVSHMKFRPLFLSVVSLVMLCGTAAHAADWPALPAACLPDRASPWDGNSGSNSFQANCHCPPASKCPKTYAEYSNPSLSPMPMEIVRQCCPEIKPPVCATGTALAGQTVPPDGNCDPKCPAGTTLAGQPIPSNGQCNPQACPPQHYPSMAEAGMQNVPSGGGGQYRTGDGKTYNFSGDSITQFFYKDDSETKALATLYGYSIRAGSPLYWQLGPGDMCRSLGHGWCPFENFYNPNTRGANDGVRVLSNVVSSVGPENLTWFGFSVADRRQLGNNFVTPAILDAFGGSERVEIGDHSFSGNVGTGYNGIRRDVAQALRNDAGTFLEQCDKAAGEFVQIESFTIDGNRCQYLQCRYVYENTAESCLAADTKITLADGSEKTVTDLKIGDLVKGSNGAHKITASNIYQSGLRVLYGINGGSALLTGDHPIKTTEGWKVINSEAAALYADKAGFAAHPLKVGDTLITAKGEVKVESITRFPKVDPISTYNIRVDGNEGFFANGIEVKGFSKMEMHYE